MPKKATRKQRARKRQRNTPGPTDEESPALTVDEDDDAWEAAAINVNATSLGMEDNETLKESDEGTTLTIGSSEITPTTSSDDSSTEEPLGDHDNETLFEGINQS